MPSAALIDRISRHWDAEIVPQLIDYVRIPAKSPHFDPAWEANGHIESVISLAERWVRAQPVRAGFGQPIHCPDFIPVEHYAVGDQCLAMPIVGAAPMLPVEQFAGDVGRVKDAGVFVLKLVQAAAAATVA